MLDITGVPKNARMYTKYQNNVMMTQGGEIFQSMKSDVCSIDNSEYGYEMFQYFTPQLYSQHDNIWFHSSETDG